MVKQTRERRQPSYTVKVRVTAANAPQVLKFLKQFGIEEGAAVRKVEREPSRADRLAECENDLNDIVSEVDSLKEELEAWKDGMHENLQGGQKASDLDEAISALEELSRTLGDVQFEVEFPSMMG